MPWWTTVCLSVTTWLRILCRRYRVGNRQHVNCRALSRSSSVGAENKVKRCPRGAPWDWSKDRVGKATEVNATFVKCWGWWSLVRFLYLLVVFCRQPNGLGDFSIASGRGIPLESICWGRVVRRGFGPTEDQLMSRCHQRSFVVFYRTNTLARRKPTTSTTLVLLVCGYDSTTLVTNIQYGSQFPTWGHAGYHTVLFSACTENTQEHNG